MIPAFQVTPARALVCPPHKETRTQRQKAPEGCWPWSLTLDTNTSLCPLSSICSSSSSDTIPALAVTGKASSEPKPVLPSPLGGVPQLTDLQLPPDALHVLLSVLRLHRVALVDELDKLLRQDSVLRTESLAGHQQELPGGAEAITSSGPWQASSLLEQKPKVLPPPLCP